MKFRSRFSLHTDRTDLAPRTRRPKWMDRTPQRRWCSRDSHEKCNHYVNRN